VARTIATASVKASPFVLRCVGRRTFRTPGDRYSLTA
jgi:hypothetical protein